MFFAHFSIGFLLLLLSFRSSLCILDINPLSIIWFANIPLVVFHCVVSFATQKFLSLISGLSIFASVPCAFEVISKKLLPLSMKFFLYVFFQEFYSFVS